MVRLSLVEYMQYLEGTETSRCVYEGEEVLNAGHIILFGKLFSLDVNVLTLCALCLQSSALNNDPHQISGVLLVESGIIKIKKMHCSCTAGSSGKCKHISAVLIKCTRENLQEVEVVSQTDLKCVWSSQKNVTRERYKPIPIKDMPCFQNKVIEPKLNVDENMMFNFFVTNLPNSAIARHSVGRRNISSVSSVKNSSLDLTFIIDHACQSVLMMELASFQINNNNECCKLQYDRLFGGVSDASVLTIQQSTQWHALRQYRITGSRIYEIYTYSKNDWRTKSLKYFFPKNFTNKYVKHGIKFENEARDAFIKTTKMEVIECGMVISSFNTWLGYSPDGIILLKGTPVALLEIKCLYEGATCTILEAVNKAKFLNNEGNKYILKKKHKYYGQVQLGMALLNLAKCYLVFYASYDKSVLVIDVDFDYDFTKLMLSTVKKNFFEEMIHNLCETDVKSLEL